MLVAQVEAAVDRITVLVADLVGLSVTEYHQQIPCTVTTSSLTARALDAGQYLFGGPCAQTAQSGQSMQVPDVLNEDRWREYAELSAASGVHSSLWLPERSPYVCRKAT